MQVQHFREFFASRRVRGRILFTGARRRSAAVKVRGDQMAEELKGLCLRTRYLNNRLVGASPALIWIAEHKPDLFARFERLTPQILDVINPNAKDVHLADHERYRPFRYLLMNTQSTLSYLGEEPEAGWRTWVIPHHHCNATAYVLPPERVERPVTVGYVGEPEHLHDTEQIEAQVAKLGLKWISADSNHLEAYRDIDIGVAWTRRESLRDDTRSNIKLANFVGHGIPSVVCDYESYRDVDQTLGGSATMIRKDIDGLLEALAELATHRELRESMAAKARGGHSVYSRHAIGRLYLKVIGEVREDFSRIKA